MEEEVEEAGGPGPDLPGQSLDRHGDSHTLSSLSVPFLPSTSSLPPLVPRDRLPSSSGPFLRSFHLLLHVPLPPFPAAGAGVFDSPEGRRRRQLDGRTDRRTYRSPSDGPTDGGPTDRLTDRRGLLLLSRPSVERERERERVREQLSVFEGQNAERKGGRETMISSRGARLSLSL